MTAEVDGKDKGNEKRTPPRPYRAYLVRCWREGADLRYSLERIGQNERRGFDDVARLLVVLKSELQSEDHESRDGGLDL